MKKRTLSPEHKEKLRLGRERARKEKKAAALALTNISATIDSNTDSTGNVEVTQTQSSQIAEDKATQRPQRIPLAEARNVMTVEHIPDGYVGRWINDEKDKLAKAQERGYVFAVDDPSGRRKPLEVGEPRVDPNRRPESIVSKVVQINQTGPLVAYLMLQRKEWYEEDQKYKRSVINQTTENLEKEALEAGLERFD